MNKLAILLCMTISSILFSQGKPSLEVSDLSSVDLYLLPELDNNQLSKRYKNLGKQYANRFAEPRDVNISLKKHGTMESVKSGKMVWRQRIKSPGAHTLNLGFTSFKLSGTLKLFIYNSDKSEVIGPFDYRDNDDHLQFWTPILTGDEIIVEAQGTLKDFANSELVLSRVNHDFKNIQKSALSGSCNIDVACGASDGWAIVDNYRDIISSVGAYTLQGIDQCTGMLVNNTLGDLKPYFITANHCNINAGNSSSVVVFWKYENRECRQPDSFESGQPGNGSRLNFNSGAIARANFNASDMALIELDDPIDPELNLFFAGWDLTPNVPDTTVCIHHPNVEEKRISFDFDRLTYEVSGQDTSFVRVEDWDLGTTEGGSSGSPIFNTKKRFIGQLLGGFAACGNDEFDTYGWIRRSWIGGGQPNSGFRSWLDPNNSGVTFIDGRSSSIGVTLSDNLVEVCGLVQDAVTVSITPSLFFDDEVTYSLGSIDSDLTVEFEFVQGQKTDVNQITISGLSMVESGNYEIDFSVSDGSDTATETVRIEVSAEEAPVPQLREPENGVQDLTPVDVELTIVRTPNVINTFQVSTKEDFSEIIIEEVTTFRRFTLESLDSDTEYFWRVKAANSCGDTDWSETFSFSTQSTFCTIIKSSDGPIEISPDAPNTIESSIQIEYPIIANEVNIPNVKIQHTWAGDLRMKLLNNNSEVLLIQDTCDETEDVDLGFSDRGEDSFICPLTDQRLYQPFEPLSTYKSRLAGGEWILEIRDEESVDGGQLEYWTIEVCFSESQGATIVPENHEINYCAGQDVEFDVYINTENTNSEIVLMDRDENNIPIEFYIDEKTQRGARLVLDSDLIVNGQDYSLRLVNSSSQSMIAFSVVQFINGGTADNIEINFPEESQTYDVGEVEQIAWTGGSGLNYVIELSDSPDFSSPVFSENRSGVNSIDINGLNLAVGTYFIRVSSSVGCGEIFSEISFVVDDGTSSNNNQGFVDTNVFPNPSNGAFYIEGSSLVEQNIVIRTYDIKGRYIYPDVRRVNNELVELNLSGQPQGLYIIHLIGENSKREFRVIKND